MICWQIATSIMRLLIMLILAYKLVQYRELFNRIERWGMGFAGGSAFLTIPSVWDLPGNPFDKWSGTVFSAGVLLYFWGRMTRHFRHAQQNAEAAAAAAEHLQARGKL